MYVLQVFADASNGVACVLLLDVPVESIVKHSNVWMTHSFGEISSIGGDVQRVGFEAVQRLDGEGHSMAAQSRTEGLQTFDASLPFVVGPPAPRHEADCG